MPTGPFDVAVIGAGVVGAAIARDLSLRGASCVLVEAGNDVGAGTSKANTAILHTGYDTKPGTIESELVPRGYELLAEYAERVGIPAAKIGALMVAWTSEQAASLPAIEQNARKVGVADTRPVGAEELYRREPALGEGAQGGLEIPGEGIICPFTTALAFATEAFAAGCALVLIARVLGIGAATGADGGPMHRLRTARGEVGARFVVNAAGLHSDEIDAMLGRDEFTIRPRRGELVVYDKLARSLVNHVLLPVPTAKTKGVLVSPTVYGNVLLGPTADEVRSREDRSTTAAGLEYLLDAGSRLMPALADHEVTATYVGLRAATEDPDYRLSIHPELRYACAGGIRSTGVTASMAIAERIREGLADAGLKLSAPTEVELRMPNIGELDPRPYQQAELVDADPEMGRIVCFCERATRGEITAALAGPIPPADLDGLRRRTRVLMG
ncbi:MAG: FAD-dependent oxidoreductase, partial [Thermoleophilaceae bacterium]|nr:FAD-dependent oxidoreductase [Thermoleophilaceae bacterium]